MTLRPKLFKVWPQESSKNQKKLSGRKIFKKKNFLALKLIIFVRVKFIFLITFFRSLTLILSKNQVQSFMRKKINNEINSKKNVFWCSIPTNKPTGPI